MESIIEWQEGTPTKNGAYLTIKKSKCKEGFFIHEDWWNNDHWVYRCSCGTPDVILWARIEDIDISQIIDKYE